MNISPRQLRIVVSLAETLSFSRTAELFHLTQPALSRIVRGIEEELGARLFLRTTRQVRLTPEGASLVGLAERLVGDYDDGLRAMRGILVRQSRRLSISALPSLAAMLLPSVAEAVRAREPEAQIEIRDVLSDATLNLVRARAVDFALTSADPSEHEIAYDEVLRDRYVLLAREDDARFAHGAPADLLALPALGLVSMPKGTAARLYADAAFLQRGVQFRPVMEFEHLATIGRFVERGFGVAFLPALAAMMIGGQGLRLLDLDDAPVRSLGVVSRRDERPSPLARIAIEAVRQSAHDLALVSPRRLRLVGGAAPAAEVDAGR